MKRLRLLATLLLPLCLAAQQLVVNPDFSQTNAQGAVTGWRNYDNIRPVTAPDASVHVTLKPGQGLSQSLRLQPDVARLALKARIRTAGLVTGKQDWQNGRLAMAFFNAQNKQVGGWPDVFGFAGTTDWQDCQREYIVPKDAVRLEFSCSHFGSAGTVDFQDVTFTVTRRRLNGPQDASCPIDPSQAQSLNDAWRQDTPTRSRLSLNGLWQARPVVADGEDSAIPASGTGWGWYKVPHAWPANWLSTTANQVPLVAQWLEDNHADQLRDVSQAWFRRTITLPHEWDNRAIAVEFTLLNTYAKVFLDGKPAGELYFPGGEVDLTPLARPGSPQELAILVKAVPLDAETQTFMAPGRIIKSKATVKSRGLCGDLYLHARPKTQRLAFVTVITSVANGTITFKAELDTPSPDSRQTYGLKATVTLPDGSTKTFQAQNLKPDTDTDTRTIAFTAPWPDAPRWDIDAPTLLTADVQLSDGATGSLLDQLTPFTFGFREFATRGKDLTLNGSVIRLRALHCYTGTAPDAALNTTEAATETIRRAREYGFNFLINAHYNFRYGQMSYLDGLLQAGQQTGILMSWSLPHLGDFRWQLFDPAVRKRYADLTRFVIRKVINNPAVVMYAMNHNSTGYFGDQNPLKIDGKYQFTDCPDWKDLATYGKTNRRVQAKHSEWIAKDIDPTRPVYHHESGNLGDLHCINIYLNWSPMQERSDWMAHWAANGVKPVFFVEWGLPHISTWSSYRGPAFIWSTPAFQSLWAAENAAAEFGEDVYRQAAAHGTHAIANEERLWAAGKPFPWYQLNWGLGAYPFYQQLTSKYTVDNWRAHRTYGVSAMLPWDQGILWQKGTPRKDLPVYRDLTHLKRPGIAPDRLIGWSDYIYAFHRDNIQPTAVGKAFLRWNMPTCAYIADQQQTFTAKTRIFRPGETIRKTIAAINDTRHPLDVTATVSLNGQTQTLNAHADIGDILFIPFAFQAPQPADGAASQTFSIHADIAFSNGDRQTDSLDIEVFTSHSFADRPLQLYDPKGLTTALLRKLGYSHLTTLAPDDNPNLDQLIVIGREALADAPALPWLDQAIRRGRVLVFEQDEPTLSARLGFRTNVHGLRELFPSRGFEQLLPAARYANWRGDATLTPPFLDDLPEKEHSDPTWNWLGFRNTRVWRAGNRGNVASVLIEKPTWGTWLPLLVGGFDLQYAPLLLHLSPERGQTLFCQLDVTARTQDDPCAQETVHQLIRLLAERSEPIPQPAVYLGAPETLELLRQLHADVTPYDGSPLDGRILIRGQGFANATPKPTGTPAAILNLGLDAKDLNAIGIPNAAETTAMPQPLPDSQPWLTRGLTSSDLYWHTHLRYTPLPPADFAQHPALAERRSPKTIELFQQAPATLFDIKAKPYLRISQRRALGLTARLLDKLNVRFLDDPLAHNAATPTATTELQLNRGWLGKPDPNDQGRSLKWFEPTFTPDDTWKPIRVAATFESERPDLADYNGLFWYRLEFDTPAHLPDDQPVIIHIGPVDDESWTWLNGQFLGEITTKTNPDNYWVAPRAYTIPKQLLRHDGAKNVLVIRINDNFQSGGILQTPHFRVRGRWLDSFYLQPPEKDDDPYRYYRW